MSKIFISYRREDSQAVAERIYDRLAARYGAGSVFMDVDVDVDVAAIEPGANIADRIRASLQRCVVQLLIIGQHWLDIQSPDGQRRLDETGDWVRVELEIALEQAKQNRLTIIPVLVAGAQMPRAVELPGPLQSLAELQALTIRDTADITRDVGRVTATIDRAIAARTTRNGGGIGRLLRFRRYLARRQLLAGISALLVLASLGVLVSITTQRPTTADPASIAQTANADSLATAQAEQTAAWQQATQAAISAATQTPAAQATQTAAAMAAQTAAAAATQTTTARTVHFPYTTLAPGPGCDAGNAPWQGAGYTCYGNYTQLSTGPVAYPYLDWYQADQPNPFPSAYTVAVKVSNLGAIWLVLQSAGGSVYQISLQSSTSSGPEYVVEQCTSLTASGGADCATKATAPYTTAGSHQLEITHTGANLVLRVDGKQVATAADTSAETTAVQVVGLGDVTDFRLG